MYILHHLLYCEIFVGVYLECLSTIGGQFLENNRECDSRLAPYLGKRVKTGFNPYIKHAKCLF